MIRPGAVFISGLLLIASLTAMPAHAVGATKVAAARPNIVIIMTDDQRWDTATPTYMPNLNRIIANNPSITYTNAFVPNSLCCPSRTSTLTGDYSHTTGIFGNGGDWGGFASFTPPPEGHSISSINDTTTIAVDMQSAGYRTALIGKYLNGYPKSDWSYVPPGWDRWFSVSTGVYYNYYAAINGHKSTLYGNTSRDYITNVLRRRAISFINNTSTQPFFLYYATTAPHGPAIPDPRDVGRFDVSGYQQPPNYGVIEDGAPGYIQAKPWNQTRITEVKQFHAKQLDSNYGVDRSIGKIWSELPDNTIVLFMSDNGYEWGEHRWTGKQVPYNEAVRIPMSIVGKNLTQPFSGASEQLVENVDVLPTLEGLAGVSSAHPIEGLDMLTSSRLRFVIEHWNQATKNLVPTYCGFRSASWMYVRYNSSEEPVNSEGLYNEQADPYEMNNLAVTDPANPELQIARDRASNLCQVPGGIYPIGWPYP